MRTGIDLRQISHMNDILLNIEPKVLESAKEKINIPFAVDKINEHTPHGVQNVKGHTYLYIDEYWQKIDDDLLCTYFIKKATKRMYPDKSITAGVVSAIKTELNNNYSIFQELPSDAMLLNLLNCIIKISSKGIEQLEHTPNYFFIYKLDYPYDPSAKAPLYSKVLADALQNDANTITRFNEHVGNIISPRSLKLEKIPLLKGSGLNSKSTLLNCIISMVGEDNVSYVEAHELSDYTNATMEGKLLNIGSDSESNIKSSTFKKLASQEKVYARFPYERGGFIIPPKQFFAINNDLKSKNDESFGLERRMDIFPFSVRPKKIDPELDSKLAFEKSGILNIALEHCLNLMTNKQFTHSDLVEKAKARYVDNISDLIRYSKTQLVSDTESRIKNQDLYNHYVLWSRREGSKPKTKQQLLSKLRDLHYISYKNDKTRGIKARLTEQTSLFTAVPSEPVNNDVATNEVQTGQHNTPRIPLLGKKAI